MRSSRFLGILAASVSLLIAPMVAQATASYSSQNFRMEGVNFGSNITLLTTVDQQPPNISSEGPSVTALKPNQVTISWRTDKKSSSVVHYGVTTAYGQQNGVPDLVTQHVVTIYGLLPETLYHFQVSSTEALGAVGNSTDRTFTTPAENGVNSIRISDVGYDSALVSWQTGNVTSSELEYGTSLAYGKSKVDQSGSLTTNHTVQLTGLTSGTVYHVRITATDSLGNSVRSSDFNFTTLANPVFFGIKVVGDSPNQVTITWVTNVPTSGVLRINEKGKADIIQSLGAGDLLVNHQTVVQMLVGQTAYQAVITATDAQGHQVTSEPQDFTTTKDTTPPVIQDLKVDVTHSGSALVMTATWKTDELSTTEATVQSKLPGTPLLTLPPQQSFTIQHIMAKADLDPATSYSLTVLSTDPSGNVGKQTISFITPAVHKSILQLLLDSLSNAFGWTGRILK